MPSKKSMRQSGFVYKFGMAQSIEGDKHRSGQTGKSICQCKIHQDNDDVVMHDPECSGILELDSLESSEESKEETICSAKPEVVVPANAAIELERRIEEMRRRNEALLERFNEVEEDRRRAERRGAALLPKSTKLVKTSYSAHTADVSEQWESLTITVMNQVPTQKDSRSVAKRSERGRRQPKSRRMDDRLEKRCEEEEKNILEERQLIICTIDNGEVGAFTNTAVFDPLGMLGNPSQAEHSALQTAKRNESSMSSAAWHAILC
ncbi:unnamed protein product [Coregonus sp. 'balchen']|nr:unnamed protein product [Coregonus sp. 'balchen']